MEGMIGGFGGRDTEPNGVKIEERTHDQRGLHFGKW